MRHVLAARAVAAGAFGIGEAPAATGLVASSRVTPSPAAGLRRIIAGTVDLATLATATDQNPDTAPGTDEQPGSAGVAVRRSAAVPWTNAPIDAIPAPHACPARVWGTASSVTAKFTSAPCLPLDTGKPLPRHPSQRQPAPAVTARTSLIPNATRSPGRRRQPTKLLVRQIRADSRRHRQLTIGITAAPDDTAVHRPMP
jgi:hypothetical protein